MSNENETQHRGPLGFPVANFKQHERGIEGYAATVRIDGQQFAVVCPDADGVTRYFREAHGFTPNPAGIQHVVVSSADAAGSRKAKGAA